MRLDSVLNGLGRPVAYYPALARTFGGVKRSLWLCQFAYWKDKQKDPDGWIHKTEDAILKETGLSRHEQKSVKKWLLENNLCEIDKRGNPAKNHYLHDWEKITELWNKHRTSQPESGPLEGLKTADKSGGNGLTISTETTAKTTSETTKKRRAPKAPLSIPDDLVKALQDFNQTAETEFVPDKGLVSVWSIAKRSWEVDYISHALHNYALSDWHRKKFRAGEICWNLRKFLMNRDGEIPKFYKKNPPAEEGTGYQPIDLTGPVMAEEELKKLIGGNQ